MCGVNDAPCYRWDACAWVLGVLGFQRRQWGEDAEGFGSEVGGVAEAG